MNKCRKIFCVLFLLVWIGGFVSTLDARSSRYREPEKHRLGLRVGYDLEASYQMPVLNKQRIEFDAGIHFGSQKLYYSVSAIYQFVFHFTEGFKCYLGPGLDLTWWPEQEMFLVKGKNPHWGSHVLANIGIEYDFRKPFQITIDWRPSYLIAPRCQWGNHSIAVGLRYRFD